VGGIDVKLANCSSTPNCCISLFPSQSYPERMKDERKRVKMKGKFKSIIKPHNRITATYIKYSNIGTATIPPPQKKPISNPVSCSLPLEYLEN
jgi:hypothetical protein